MSLVESLKRAQIFVGLTQDELERVAALCQPKTFQPGETILSAGETTRELFIIGQGMVEVSLSTAGTSTPIVNLGAGQVVGEMTLVDRGARSATVKAVNEDTVLYAIPHQTFLELCERDNHIGFVVMRNLAAEMSLKLRYANIAEQMGAGR